jgi:hypothetical protein
MPCAQKGVSEDPAVDPLRIIKMILPTSSGLRLRTAKVGNAFDRKSASLVATLREDASGLFAGSPRCR